MNIEYIATLFADCCSPASLELVLPTVPLGAWWEANQPRPEMLWRAAAEGQVADMLAIGGKLFAAPVVVATHVSKSVTLPVVVYDMGHSSVSCWGNFYRDFVALSAPPEYRGGSLARSVELATTRPWLEVEVGISEANGVHSYWRVSLDPGLQPRVVEVERYRGNVDLLIEPRETPAEVWRAAATQATRLASCLAAKAGGAP